MFTGKKQENLCPFDKKPCVEHGCKLFIKMYGKHPQKDAMVEEWDCALSWMPVLLVENSQRVRETGAAVESFRNEVVTQHGVFLNAMQALAARGREAKLTAVPTLLRTNEETQDNALTHEKTSD